MKKNNFASVDPWNVCTVVYRNQNETCNAESNSLNYVREYENNVRQRGRKSSDGTSNNFKMHFNVL